MATNEISTFVSPPKAMMIKNLCPGLQEVGKIKIGNKGKVRQSGGGKEWQPPQKLDHFLITTLERGADGNYVVDRRLQDKFGGEACKSIPVRLIYDDIALNFASRYICYYGKTVFCSGDGETAQRMQRDGSHQTINCPCERQDPKYAGDNGPKGPDCLGGNNGKGKCKINGILSAIIDGADSVGGVWKFRTTSYNTVVGIMSSLALISRITGGRLAGIPLNMTVSPKTTQDPVGGGQVTVYVVGLTFAGNMEMLRNTGYQIAMDEAKHGISMKEIEARAMTLLSHVPTSGALGDEDAEDVIEEFYPEEAMSDAGLRQTSGPAPALVQEAQVIEKQEPAAPAAAPPRERGKPSPGRQRRTKEEVAEDNAADERDAAAQQAGQQTGTVATLETCPCEHPTSRFDGDDEYCDACGVQLNEAPPFPDLTDEPNQVTEQQVADTLGHGANQPAGQQQNQQAGTTQNPNQNGAQLGDLF
jgi:hypothetical protein